MSPIGTSASYGNTMSPNGKSASYVNAMSTLGIPDSFVNKMSTLGTLDSYVNVMSPLDSSYPNKVFTMVIVMLLIITFVVGLVVNNLYLWVLVRMTKTVNSTWFFHLVLVHQVFTLILPLGVVQLLVSTEGIFEVIICKFINSLLATTMYGGVFFLTAISIDRYLLVFKPLWNRTHMNPRRATFICMWLWVLAILLSTPYMILGQIPKENSTSICDIDYSLSAKWESPQIRYQAKWGFFGFRFLEGYLLPFFVISFCSLRLALKFKKEKLTRSSKAYKILFITVISFFVCWMPYYVMNLMMVVGGFEEKTLEVMWLLTVCFGCFYSCFTPVFHLLSVHSFKAFCGNSVLSLMESVFKELSQ